MKSLHIIKLQSGVTGHEVRVVDETSLDVKKSNMKKIALVTRFHW